MQLVKPATASSITAYSVPPARATSTWPHLIAWKASPTSWAEVAQAVTTGRVGPVACWRMETAPQGMLAIMLGIMSGPTLRGPSLWHLRTFSIIVWKPPMPEPT